MNSFFSMCWILRLSCCRVLVEIIPQNHMSKTKRLPAAKTPIRHMVDICRKWFPHAPPMRVIFSWLGHVTHAGRPVRAGLLHMHCVMNTAWHTCLVHAHYMQIVLRAWATYLIQARVRDCFGLKLGFSCIYRSGPTHMAFCVRLLVGQGLLWQKNNGLGLSSSWIAPKAHSLSSVS